MKYVNSISSMLILGSVSEKYFVLLLLPFILHSYLLCSYLLTDLVYSGVQKKQLPLRLRIFSSHICEEHERILLKLVTTIKDML